MTEKREQRVFLVRMWRENAERADDWRGSLDEVGTGRRYYFTSPVEVADLIAGTLRTAPQPNLDETER